MLKNLTTVIEIRYDSYKEQEQETGIAMAETAKKVPRAVATARKKKKIYDKSLALFKERGYDNVTMKDISKATGMSEGSIFHFFGSKAGILSGFNEQMFKDASVYFEPTEENLKNPVEAIINGYYSHGESFAEIGAELTSMYYNNVMDNYEGIVNIKDADEAVSYLYKPFYDFVLAAVDAGTLKLKVSPETFTSMIYTFCNGLVLVWTRAAGTFDLMELSRPEIRTLIESLVE